MNAGRTVFAQLMDFIPVHEFRRCVARYRGQYRVRSFSCWDQFLSMAFAQLTYRESLRDIETCLRALGGKLYHLGIRGHLSRSTLADANETRAWRIFADLARVLIIMARPLYAGDPLGVELEETAYALDCTTIDLCLSLFPWARSRRLNAAVSMHPLLRPGDRSPADFSHQQFFLAHTHHSATVQVPLASRAVLQMDQAAPAHQSVLRTLRERREDANLDSHRRLRAGGHRAQASGTGLGTSHYAANSERHLVRENPLDSSTYANRRATRGARCL